MRQVSLAFFLVSCWVLAPPGSCQYLSIGALAPARVPPGSGAFTLTVTGFGFDSGTTVLWNGQARATTFPSSNSLQALIPASDIAFAGVAEVSVTKFNPIFGGVISSTPVTFSITPVTVGGAVSAATVNQCSTPISVTSFNVEVDTRAYVWFTVTGAGNGDSAALEWHYPDGSLYQVASSYSPITTPGNYCYFWSLNLAGNPSMVMGN